MPTSQWGREHPNEIDTPEDHEWVSPIDALEHGYHGVRVDTTPREDYTVAGVTSGESRLTGPGVETNPDLGEPAVAATGSESEGKHTGTA